MRRILIQLDTDAQPSSFDRVVAVDAGVDELFAYGSVTPRDVTSLVHGAMFTRAPADLRQTAIFIGGSDVAAGEALLEQVKATFFGPLRVSVMMDSNGCNTTAAAAVRAAARHLELQGSQALVLGGTGPVGQRAAQLLCQEGARVRLASRSADRAESTCREIRARMVNAAIEPLVTSSGTLRTALQDAQLLIAAGAAGVRFLSDSEWMSAESLRLAIDINAVPPLGLKGIDVTDKGNLRGSVTCYGAIGVGGSKMKIHKAAVRRLFEANDHVLDTTEIYRISEEVG